MKIFRYVIPLFLCFILSLGSDYLTIREAMTVPVGKTYVYGYGAYTDYFYYLSIINEGTRKKFIINNRYTTNEYPPVLAHPFFTTAGFIGDSVGLSPPLIFWASRIIGGALLLYSMYIVGKIMFKKYVYISFFTVLLSVPMWSIKNGAIYQWCDFWHGFDPIGRITFLSHHLFSNIFGILSLLLINRAFQKKRMWWGIVAILSILLSIGANPAISLIYTLTILIAICIQTVRSKINRSQLFLIICFTISVAVIYVFFYQIYNSEAWNVTNVERQLWYPIDTLRFLLALGPMAAVAIFAIIFNRKWTFLFTSLTIWFILPILLLFLFPYISQYIPLVIIRFVQSAPYIPTGLLAYSGIRMFYTFIKHKPPVIKYFGIVTILCLYAFAIPSYIINSKNVQKLYDFNHVHEPGFYISDESYDVLTWLHNHATPDEVILSVEPISYMIPAFTHLVNPVGSYLTKKNDITLGYEVFTFKTTEATQDFLKSKHISYLLVHAHEKPTDQFLHTFAFQEIYRNSKYILYYRNL